MNEKQKKQSVKVSIMQREFTVACQPEESQGLLEAAAYLDEQMQAVAKGSKALGLERCATMAALNIAHELLQLKSRLNDDQTMHQRLEKLNQRIEESMANMQE